MAAGGGNAFDSFFVALGFDVDTSKLDEFKAKTHELRNTILEFGAIAAGAAAGLGLLVHGVAQSMGELYEFAELNEVTAKSVAGLARAGLDYGITLDAVKSSIQGVNSIIGQAALGIGRGAKIFEKLGFKAKDANGNVKDVYEVLGEVADRMQKMSRQEQIAMATKLGIDPSFIKMLKDGSVNLAKLREEAELYNPFKEADYKLARDVNVLFIKAKASLGTFTKMLGVSLLPIAKQVLTTYLEWFKATRKATSGAVISALQAVSAVLGTLWDWLVRIVVGFKGLYDALVQNTVVVYAAAFALGVFVSIKVFDFLNKVAGAFVGLTTRIAAFNVTALIIPAIIGAIAIAIGLLIDDYLNWKEGNDSVIGGLVQKFPMLLQFITALEKGVGKFVDLFLTEWKKIEPAVMKLVSTIWQLVSLVAEILWPVIKTIFTGWVVLLSLVLPIISTIIIFIADLLVSAILFLIDVAQTLLNVFVTVFQGIKYGIDFIVGAFDYAANKVQDFIKMISGAIEKVGAFFGMQGGQVDFNATADSINAGGASSGPGASGGVIGSAGSSTTNTTSTQTTQITGTQITVNSPDPLKAGEMVKKELDDMNKRATRNGQSGVGL